MYYICICTANIPVKNAKVAILGFTFKENCPDTRNSKVVDIINRLKEYDIDPVVTDSWADPEVAKKEYGVDLVPFDSIPRIIEHTEFKMLEKGLKQRVLALNLFLWREIHNFCL